MSSWWKKKAERRGPEPPWLKTQKWDGRKYVDVEQWAREGDFYEQVARMRGFVRNLPGYMKGDSARPEDSVEESK